jgi:hypothetical protein
MPSVAASHSRLLTEEKLTAMSTASTAKGRGAIVAAAGPWTRMVAPLGPCGLYIFAMRKVYLDMCALKRPFDDQRQGRIWIETQAVLRILSAFERGDLRIVSSAVLLLENDHDPDSVRKHRTAVLLASFGTARAVGDTVFDRAQRIIGFGISDIDALHLAAAEEYGASHFITCDDDVIRKATEIGSTLIITNPTDFVKELRT